MRKHAVVFDDSFFDALAEQVEAERDGYGRPSRTDVLAYEVMPLLELLADDYLNVTLPVPDDDLFRVLMQPGLIVQRINLYIYDLDGTVHVFYVEVEHLPLETIDDTSDE